MCAEYRYSERGVIRQGEIFRARGGPTYKGQRVGSPGLYKLLDVVIQKKRTYLLGMLVNKHGLPVGGTSLLYVKGSPYPLDGLPDWAVNPYKISKKRSER